ncbi:MAG: GntP family permease [Wenzhouxiangellaceae bacterium]
MLSIVGLIGGLALLILLTIRGMNLLLAAPLCALVVALAAGIDVFPSGADGQLNFIHQYMNGFTGFVAAWFFMFLLGALFGKLMEDCGAAESVSNWIVERFGPQRAPLAVVLACAVLTYGGVSLFVVAFSVYPLALMLFKQADLPRRFIPGTIAFGSVTFTMTSAGSPEIQNWIPIRYLGTTPYAAWEVSLIVAIAMAVFGYWWLQRMLAAARQRGESFAGRTDDPEPRSKELPHPLTGLMPLLVVLGTSFLLHEQLQESALIVALLAGCLATIALNWRYFLHIDQAIHQGTLGALVAIGNTSAVVGFGTIAKASPAFTMAVDSMTSIPGNPLIGAAVAVSAIAALTGSASGGQAIALPELAPGYLDAGVNPEQLHRVVAISSGALDSLPHNGYVVTTIRAICGETHRHAYGPMGALTVIVPLGGLLLALLLFSLGL